MEALEESGRVGSAGWAEVFPKDTAVIDGIGLWLEAVASPVDPLPLCLLYLLLRCAGNLLKSGRPSIR